MECAKRMEFQALSRRWHVDDLPQDCVHVVRRFRARKAYASAQGIGEIRARHGAGIVAWVIVSVVKIFETGGGVI
jgi:hypothetical protein